MRARKLFARPRAVRSAKRDARHREAAESKEVAAQSYPTILREYASSGFRDGHSRRRAVSNLRRVVASRRTGVYRDRPRQEEAETQDARERYGDGGPYWQRKG